MTVLDKVPEVEGYETLDFLGEGATGQVWAVRNADGVRFAAKFVPADSDQFDVEASLLTAIDHDHVVRVHDVISRADGTSVLVMDLAEGGSLADALVGRGHLSDGELVTVLSPIARALHDLHGMGLVHADLSPGNILFTVAGKPLIADFGVSRLAGHVGDQAWATEAWAAPEVLSGQSPTPQSDAYSIGAIAWACLTGAPPEPVALRPDLGEVAPWASDRVRDLVLACLSHTPEARPSVGEFATMLWECARAEPAPVKGSRGRRAAALPEPELTRRLRRERREASALEQLAAKATPPVRRGRPEWLTNRVVAGLGAVGVIGAVGAAMLPLGAPTASGVASMASAPPSSAQPSSSRSSTSASSVSRAAPAAPASAKASPAAVPAALVAPTTSDLQRLLTARATAWARTDTATLAGYAATGSAAEQRDRASLATAVRDKANYHGLRFTVRSVQVRSDTPKAVTVRAKVDQSAYDVTTPAGREHRAARPGQQVDIDLVATADGWRVKDWRAAA